MHFECACKDVQFARDACIIIIVRSKKELLTYPWTAPRFVPMTHRGGQPRCKNLTPAPESREIVWKNIQLYIQIREL